MNKVTTTLAIFAMAVASASAAAISLGNLNAQGTATLTSPWAAGSTVTWSGGAMTVNSTDISGYQYFQAINATGYNYLVVTASRGGSNTTQYFKLQFINNDLDTATIQIQTSSFAVGTPTTVYVPITWGAFNKTNITDFNLGGGNPAGSATFNMTISQLELNTVPEPSTYAAIFGLGALGFAMVRRFRAKK